MVGGTSLVLLICCLVCWSCFNGAFEYHSSNQIQVKLVCFWNRCFEVQTR